VEAHSSNKTYYDLESILVFSNFINPVQNNQSAICEKDREVEREITIGVDSSKMTELASPCNYANQQHIIGSSPGVDKTINLACISFPSIDRAPRTLH
jgi:hypothetical protein